MERFWNKVRKSDGCWTWTGHIDKDGYGRFGAKAARAHRVAYELERGPVLPNACVLHSCDNPPCVNPAHLFIGSRKSNADDREAKKRHPHCPGEKNGRAKLTVAMVIKARQRRAAGETTAAMAREYGVRWETLYRAIMGRTFRAAPAGKPEEKP